MAEKPAPMWMNVTAGGIAGVAEILCCYPLDVVKTRQQLHSGASANLVKTFSTMIKNEGVGSLYRAPKRAIKFAANDFYKRLFANQYDPLTTRMAAGATESVVVVSPDLLKIRLQDKANKGLYSSTSDAFFKILKTEGFFAFWRGLEATMLRHIVWNAGYFGCIQYVRSALPKRDSKQGVMMNNFIAGAIGGTVGTILNTPFDVVKSRVQGQVGAARKYNWCLPALAKIAREEGFGALYKGFIPKVLRLGPGGGILLVTYDVVIGFMRKNYM